MPAVAGISVPIALIKVVAVEQLVVGFHHSQPVPWDEDLQKFHDDPQKEVRGLRRCLINEIQEVLTNKDY